MTYVWLKFDTGQSFERIRGEEVIDGGSKVHRSQGNCELGVCGEAKELEVLLKLEVVERRVSKE